MQNINLLETISKTNKSWLKAKLFFQILVAWVTLLLLIYFISLVKNHELSNELNQLKDNNNKLTQQIAVYIERTKKNPNGNFLGATDLEYNAIQEVTKKYSSIGFSESLHTLSEDVPNGMWLENFAILRNENSITFSGQTTSENLIPIFLTNLSKDKSFTGIIFNKVNIRKNLSDKKIKFTVSNGVIE